MMKLEITYIKIDNLRMYKNNAKLHPEEQVNQIATSIEKFGFNDPIAVDENNVIIEGHGRLLAVKKLIADNKFDCDDLPCIVLKGLTEQQKKAYILAHNKLTMISGFDLDVLNQELAGIVDFDMCDFGFIDDTTQTEDKEIVDDDYDESIPTQTNIKRGQVYKLGHHFVMCGDSTKKEDVEKLMSGTKADLFLTDPPYGVSIGTKWALLNSMDKGGRIGKDIVGDTLGKQDISGLWKSSFVNAYFVSKDDCSFYIFSPQAENIAVMINTIQDTDWTLKHTLIWVKNVAVFSLGRLDYDYKHEPILYGWKKKHNFYANDYQVSVFDNKDFTVDDLTERQCKKLLREIIDTANVDVIYEDKVKACDLHPTMKPVPLLGKLIKNSSKKDDVVLDLFGGSGSTLIACEQLGRHAYLMEYDEKYVQVIIDRWEKYTGCKAELMKM